MPVYNLVEHLDRKNNSLLKDTVPPVNYYQQLFTTKSLRFYNLACLPYRRWLTIIALENFLF